MNYRNHFVDWFSCKGFGDGYSSVFGIYVDFISYLILQKFALLDKKASAKKPFAPDRRSPLADE